jgi:hypothetical protein
MPDAVNIQRRNIASIVCPRLAAAVPLNVVKTFKISGTCDVADEEALFCTIRPNDAERQLVPFPSPFAEIPDPRPGDCDLRS